eukprot:CAMPEP_0183724108 /NCGR_PEP_ID=MMETSP0737-20130205/17279_1 /TAXON_ID=385413 /ORGANISM="Thalassiosira miniscula, Strain CCMP1093" /LENGTH=833 /DNA_ID=CAMNT_0025954589 /DNA_START=101 /DNA_END=2599 /DNA_ORIENTATION=+
MSNNEVPPIITTAHLLLRGLVPAFLGCSIGSDDILLQRNQDNNNGSSDSNDTSNTNNNSSNSNVAKGGAVQASAFQMTYRKDLPKLGKDGGGYTGKLSWNLGKKWGSENCALGASSCLPREEEMTKEEFDTQCEQFWVALETAAARLLAASSKEEEEDGEISMKKYDFDNEESALEAMGKGIMDAGQAGARDKRQKKALKAAKEGKEAENAAMLKGEASSVGHLIHNHNTLAVALLHGTSLLPLSKLGAIRILRSNPRAESGIVCNKKKCEVVIKFSVVPAAAEGREDAMMDISVDGSSLETLGNTNVTSCMSKEIRVKEGIDYQTSIQLQKRQKEMEALSTKQKEEEQAASAAAAATAATAKNDDEMVVTAFEVSGSIDYDKLIDKFGSKPLTPYLLRRLENVTVKRGTVPFLHRFLRREIFFSHRDIEKICELLEGWYGVPPPPPEDDGSGDTDTAADAATPAVAMKKPTTPCPIYLYTGRGPSSGAMHLGHLVPFLFTAWLQRAFQCPLVIQMTDDEKFLFKGEYSGEHSGDGRGEQQQANRTGDNLDRFANLTMENAKDIIACDFIKEKTFLFSDLDYVGRMYPNIVRIWKAVTVNQVNGIFGFDGGSNIGKIAFPAIQAAPSFGSSFPYVLGDGSASGSSSSSNGGGSSGSGGLNRGSESTLACLIPCAIDQDPYFRLTRDIAHKLVPKHHPLQGKPSLIHSKFFPPLQGAQGKMSSSDANSAVFLTDTPEDIERKIKQHAFSGGQDTRKLQELHGANLDVDVSYQWLRFFLEDDEELARIGREYGSGSGEFWSTGLVKAKLVGVLKELVEEHQERRGKVTEEVVREW